MQRTGWLFVEKRIKDAFPQWREGITALRTGVAQGCV
jgi:hypothetical protein